MPTWLQSAVIYHIFIDRFAGYARPDRALEPVFVGGNLRGITQKLPYLAALGVDVLWLSPFFQGEAYHGYHTTDMYAIDERFGTERDLRRLLDTAHRKGMRVICDFVPNHVSDHHPYFVDAVARQDSPYKDWFLFDEWPKQYQMFLSVPELPKLNLDNPEALAHVRGAARKWLELGIDGFRIDHIIGLSNQQVRELINPLRKAFPDAAFIGEAVMSGVKYHELRTLRVPHVRVLWLLMQLRIPIDGLLYRNYVGILDGALNFAGAQLLEAYARAKSPRMRVKIATKLHRQERYYQDKLLLPTFLDNHDIERFLFRCGGDEARLRDAVKLQGSLNNPMIIYYGTEVGLSQQESFTSQKHHSDILARQPMPWDPAKQNAALRRFYAQVLMRRRQRLNSDTAPTRARH